MAVSLSRDSRLYLCLVCTRDPPRHSVSRSQPNRAAVRRRPEKQRAGGGTRPPPGTQQSPSVAPRTHVPKESTATPQACGAASPSQPGLPASQLTSRLLSQPNSSFRIINSAAQEKSSLPDQGWLALASRCWRGREKVCTRAGGEESMVRGVTRQWGAGTSSRRLQGGGLLQSCRAERSAWDAALLQGLPGLQACARMGGGKWSHGLKMLGSWPLGTMWESEGSKAPC